LVTRLKQVRVQQRQLLQLIMASWAIHLICLPVDMAQTSLGMELLLSSQALMEAHGSACSQGWPAGREQQQQRLRRQTGICPSLLQRAAAAVPAATARITDGAQELAAGLAAPTQQQQQQQESGCRILRILLPPPSAGATRNETGAGGSMAEILSSAGLSNACKVLTSTLQVSTLSHSRSLAAAVGASLAEALGLKEQHLQEGGNRSWRPLQRLSLLSLECTATTGAGCQHMWRLLHGLYRQASAVRRRGQYLSTSGVQGNGMVSP
jgi:hypothetical protein